MKSKIVPKKKSEEKLRKKVLEGYGKFSGIGTSSRSFTKEKGREIKRENRRSK
ncbi:MAG: hypothetical protein ACHQM6_10520 [Candidatus Kapaibacterium sp.]